MIKLKILNFNEKIIIKKQRERRKKILIWKNKIQTKKRRQKLKSEKKQKIGK